MKLVDKDIKTAHHTHTHTHTHTRELEDTIIEAKQNKTQKQTEKKNRALELLTKFQVV